MSQCYCECDAVIFIGSPNKANVRHCDNTKQLRAVDVRAGREKFTVTLCALHAWKIRKKLILVFGLGSWVGAVA